MSTPAPSSLLPIPWAEDAQVLTHTGGCHCKKVRYEFQHPDIYTMEVVSCNCTICESRGALNVYTPDAMFKFTSGTETLREYRFGDEKIHHRFCAVCGAAVGAHFAAKGFAIVNVRSVDGIDLGRLKLKAFNGRAWN
ncbi:GFA domain-containing protein [Mycena kentingensis (nom. inval.)]|nr:GFA domain-containing protein [Mycena kentingensis (nom. inval.)]